MFEFEPMIQSWLLADRSWLVTQADPSWAESWSIVAQANPDVDVGPGPGLVAGAVGAFLSTLVVGGLLLTFAQTYAEGRIAAVLENPVGSFGWGIVALLALVVLTVLLAITIIGIFVAIPLLLLSIVVWAIGAAIGYLAIAERLVGHEDGWLTPLLLAAAINGALALTGIGGLVSFAVGATGFGAVLRGWLG